VFGFKWKQLDTYDSAEFKRANTVWALERYGFQSVEDWAAFFRNREKILDVGCGSGFSSSLWLNTPDWDGEAMWVGVDISDAIDVALERLHHIQNAHFVQGDALALPFPDECFDTIFSEGVLHHTPSTRDALLSCSRVLARNGEIHFYVYRRKGPIREFTDDYIRQQIAALSNEEVWKIMQSLTRLGKALWETGAEIDLEEDISILGIKAGPQKVQRLIYWDFAKLYWNPAFSFEENVHVNFDWYSPRYAHRQTAEEVRQWCDEANLSITRIHEQESGFSVRAMKR
jgi:ubiquinone/menaquinone biosynthesis C-methylase UbiE